MISVQIFAQVHKEQIKDHLISEGSRKFRDPSFVVRQLALLCLHCRKWYNQVLKDPKEKQFGIYFVFVRR